MQTDLIATPIIASAPPHATITAQVIQPIRTRPDKTTALQAVLVMLGGITFLYFARAVVLPVVLACVAGVTLKPLVRWFSYCHLPTGLSAAIVVCLLVLATCIGFFQLGRPALTWKNEAPQHLTVAIKTGQALHIAVAHLKGVKLCTLHATAFLFRACPKIVKRLALISKTRASWFTNRQK
jgi:hypothetical protein